MTVEAYLSQYDHLKAKLRKNRLSLKILRSSMTDTSAPAFTSDLVKSSPSAEASYARIMDQLAEAGVVGPEMGTKPREIRMSISEFEELINAQ